MALEGTYLHIHQKLGKPRVRAMREPGNGNGGVPYTVMRFEDAELAVYSAAAARDLLAAAFEAVKIVDPGGAQDALGELIETDGAEKILAGAHEPAEPEPVAVAVARNLLAELPDPAGLDSSSLEKSPFYWFGQLKHSLTSVLGLDDEPGPGLVTPPAACTECGATDTPLDDGRCHNLDLCADRQAAKASTR
jgi:hypothetical protein